MNAGYEALVEYFDSNQWHYDRHDDDLFIHLGFTGEHGQFRCVAAVNEENDVFQFFSFVPLRGSEAQRPGLSEFICRANYGMKFGRFELDFDDGDLRFHTSTRYYNQLSQERIRDTVGSNLLTVDRYLPGLALLLFAGAEPLDAIRSAEKGTTHTRRRWDVAG
ncbi:MAG: YbjN domain-containing protein [Verrucomicrobiales bacterium]